MKWTFPKFREEYVIDGYRVRWMGFEQSLGTPVQLFAIIDANGYVVNGFTMTDITRDEDVTYEARRRLGKLPYSGRDDDRS